MGISRRRVNEVSDLMSILGGGEVTGEPLNSQSKPLNRAGGPGSAAGLGSVSAFQL